MSIKERAELALIITLPETTKDLVKPGRLKNQIAALGKEADKIYFEKFYNATKEELSKISDGLRAFDEKMKWTERPRHILSYLSAISIFIQGRGYFSKLTVSVKLRQHVFGVLRMLEEFGKKVLLNNPLTHKSTYVSLYLTLTTNED